MTRAALAAVRAMSEQARSQPAEEKVEETGTANPFAAAAAMWPWNMMSSQQAAPPAPPIRDALTAGASDVEQPSPWPCPASCAGARLEAAPRGRGDPPAAPQITRVVGGTPSP